MASPYSLWINPDLGRLRNFWQEVLLFLEQTDHDNITKARFGRIFSPVWDKAIIPATDNVVFKGIGIYPLNP